MTAIKSTRSNSTRNNSTRSIIAAFVAAFLAAPGASGHEPGDDNELPGGGTAHELRITSLTSASVAQQIVQRVICSSPSRCLHDEVHLPVVINFETGEIGIDATELTDENGDLIETGLLFQTLSGPAELIFAPPCENPDGCIGGTPIYLGTIDTDGNIAFPSVGLDFDLFGFDPVTMFDAPMGTGQFVDENDPTEIAEGVQLDFATGNVVLTGIQFIPAPIIGNGLIKPQIVGQILPIPTPPADPRTLAGCQGAIEKQSRLFVSGIEPALHQCVQALVSCQVDAEAGVPSPASCSDDAVVLCNGAFAEIADAKATFAAAVGAKCNEGLAAANLLSAGRGLGFALADGECASLDVDDLGSQDAIAECVARSLQCSVEELVSFLDPRAGEVLSAQGLLGAAELQGCIPAFATGDASGSDADALLSCQSTLGGQTAGFAKTKQGLLLKCMHGFLDCELDDLDEAGLTACRQAAAGRCESLATRIERVGGRKDGRVAKACLGVAPADLGAGLGFDALAEHCAGFDPPFDVTSLDSLLACIATSADCEIEGIVRAASPRAADALADFVAEGGVTDLLERFACLAPACGNGSVDRGEECDPFYDIACRDGCIQKVCGDGILDAEIGEECDDGNTDAFDGCDATCLEEPFACGNGILEPFGMEVCDDQNSAGGDGCSPDCMSLEVCGNGVVDDITGEQCDDANFDDGDGCSADCRSDETCGNGVIDVVAGEQCDDGNALSGDGCSSCSFEGCGFFGGAALGTRVFSVDPSPAASGHVVSLPLQIGNVAFTSGDFLLNAGAPDASTGNAPVTLEQDVVVAIQVNLGGLTQCIKFQAVDTTGVVHCCGGHASGMSFARDSNTGGIGGNGPSVIQSGVGAGTRGDLEMAFRVSFAQLDHPPAPDPPPPPEQCATASYGGTFTQFWTSGEALGLVLNPLQGGAEHAFSRTGEPFECSTWTTENALGEIGTADTALNSAPTLDLLNVRFLDDDGGN